MLHLLTWRELVFANPFWWCAQVGVPDPAGQGAIGEVQTILREQFAHPDRVAACTAEGRLQTNQRCFVAWEHFGNLAHRLAQNPPHGVA